MSPDRHPHLSLRLPVWRMRFILLFMLLGFTGLGVRAMYLQGMEHDELQAQGELRYGRVLEIPAHRGTITDRHGEPLAVSTPVESIAVSPSNVEITPKQKARLAQLLDIDPAELAKRLEAGRKGFVYLARQIAPELAARVMALDVPGVLSLPEHRRYYPAAEVLAQVIGFTNIDGKGKEGIELAYESHLAGRPGSRKVIQDRRGRVIEDVENVRAPQQGRDLALSIDLKLQYLAYRELRRAVIENRAKAGSIVVLDATSGEVLALANLPTFNPNNRSQYRAERARNRAIVDLFEPGSTLKPFTVAAALEHGVVRPDTLVDTEGGHLTVSGRTIHDAHVNGTLTVSQVIQKSSNVGIARIALSMPAHDIWQVLSMAGFGTTPRIDFPGAASGRLRDPHTWRPIEQATVSYGHGISVSLLQLAHAYTIFCDDGELMPLTLIRREDTAIGTPVIPKATALAVRAMLELVTQPGGTAPNARINGYRVAGKTGTAHKFINGVYSPDRYMASFIGIAPASRPRLIVAVAIDEPSAGRYYGGQVAAPVATAVLTGALRALAVPPDAPITHAPVKRDAEAIPEEV
ncbi:MAG: penicillin-binding protein 2 [Betaproteobacteria bacterium]|nr:penicillin-binding protein 2 [Betaproteobacteria bacterium]